MVEGLSQLVLGYTPATVPGGRFGFMFPGLPAQGEGVPGETIRGWLASLGAALRDDVDANGRPFPAGDHPSLPAGYTYLGQFIDHDLTFDPTALPDGVIDISSLVNFRSAALDLDCLLGLGPSVSSVLYEGRSAGPQAGRLRTAESLQGNLQVVAHDLPRLPGGTPLIGDRRNDENLAVGQLHTAFLTFFNTVYDGLLSGTLADIGPAGGTIGDKASRLVRWHYQWIVLRDFLPRIIETPILDAVIINGPQYYRPQPGQAYMPVEFAGAAFRLGHSMVRERYHWNSNFRDATLAQLFSFSSSGGAVPVPSSWFANWNRLFEIDGQVAVNRSRRLDQYTVPGLHQLPDVPSPGSLAVRNLLRGWSWGLPSGQSVANRLQLTALRPDQILTDPGGQLSKEAQFVEPFNFHVDTPLWYYILKESEVYHLGERLGPVGSTILAEAFVGLLLADAESYLSQNPGWLPVLPRQYADQFTMADLFRFLPGEALNPVGGDTGPL